MMIRKAFKKFIPNYWLEYYNYKKKLWRKCASENIKINDRFTEYYNTNHWGGKESISGRGSDSFQTEILIKELSKLFNDYNIKSILDIPCGDFNWMKNLDFSDKNYLGGDIVPDLIFKNREFFADRVNVRFEVMDITKDDLPKVDIIICRDCLVHLSYKDIFKSISNIKKNNCNFLLATSFIDRKRNYNILTGDWRPINLEKKPFNFPIPQLIINENCTEDNGKYSDKSMCLWNISNIEVKPFKY